jgi:UDP-2,3-diacylglucosamine hydrolase
MRAVFLSDAHLKHSSDLGYNKCVQFFSGLAGPKAVGDRGDRTKMELLVIAGDFFDFWFERNGRIYPEFKTIVESILRLKEEGVRICMCEGNHDFFLADYFEKRYGIEVYPDDLEMQLDNLKVFVSHGDTVDKEKKAYLALRILLRSSVVYRLQKILPLRLLWSLAQSSSSMSREMVPNRQKRLVEVMHEFAQKQFENGFDAVILGHSHVAELTEKKYKQRIKTFITLGDWITQYVYLIYENGRFSLCRF